MEATFLFDLRFLGYLATSIERWSTTTDDREISRKKASLLINFDKRLDTDVGKGISKGRIAAQDLKRKAKMVVTYRNVTFNDIQVF